MKIFAIGFAFSLGLLSSVTGVAGLKCGDRVSGTVRLEADLDCTATGVANALIIDGPTQFEGAGFSIRQAEGGTALFISNADSVSVKNVRLHASVGIFAFDSDALLIDGVEVLDSVMGVTVYAQERTLANIAISRLTVRGARIAGVNMQSDGRGKILAPRLSGLVVQSEGFAIHIVSESLTLDADSSLDLGGSSSGLYFSGRHLKLKGLDWSRTPIRQGVIHAHRAARVEIENCDFSSALSDRQEARDRVGVHLDQVGQSEIKGLTVTGREVGVVITTVRNVFARADILDSVLTANQTAGVWIQSQDGSPFGRVRVMRNDLRGYASTGHGARAIVRHGDTQLGAGSSLTENRF